MNSRVRLLAALMMLAVPVLAQTPAQFSVIVVFQDNVRFQDFSPLYRADQRAGANPPAWGYVDRGVAGAVQYLERRGGFQAEHVFSHSLRGFSARLTARQVQELEADSMVRYIEPDGTMSITAQTLPWGIDRIDADLSSTMAGDGSGSVTTVNVYVIDTGVDKGHADLNVVGHVNFANGPNDDCNGHGTHVAGTIAARDNTSDVVGVVPGAPIRGVRVLGCNGSGSTSGVIKGIDYVTANAIKPAVANMSLGGSASTALDDAVKKSVDSGVVYAIAAGNSGDNACNYSPARAGTKDGVITVAATDPNNNEASFSNFGACVDVWAPGVNILSTKKGGGTTTMSGTSMASPHAAGTAALFLSTHLAANPATIESALKMDAMSTGKTSKDGASIKLLQAGTY